MNPPNDIVTEMMTGEVIQETEEEMEARIDAEDYSTSDNDNE